MRRVSETKQQRGIHMRGRASFVVLLVLSTMVPLVSCSELVNEVLDECGPDGNSDVMSLSLAQALTSSDLLVSFDNGARVFEWIVLVENVCTKDHVNAVWEIGTQRPPMPAGWEVTAGWATTAVLGDDVVLKAETATGSISYTGNADIGLKQAHGRGPGRFNVGVRIEFTSQGNETEDRAVLQRALNRIDVRAYYKAYKAP